MATQDNKIKFSIASAFNGEGFKKADLAVKSAGKTAAKTSAQFSSLFSTAAAEAEGLGGAMGKLGGQVSSVAKGFMSMGIVGGVLAAVKIGVDSITSALKDLEEKWEALEKDWNATIDADNAEHMKRAMDEVANSMKSLNGEAKANLAAFDAMTASAAKMAEAVSKVADAKGATTISEMLIKQYNSVVAEETKSMKALVSAQHDAAIAQERENQVRQQQASKISAAQAAYAASLTAIDRAAEQEVAAQQAVTAAENAVALARQKYGTTSAQYTQALAAQEKAQAELQKSTSELAARQRAAEVAEENIVVAQTEATAAINNATLSVRKAEEAVKEAEKAARISAMQDEAKAESVRAAQAAMDYYTTQLEKLDGKIAEQQEAVKAATISGVGLDEAQGRLRELMADHADATKKLESADTALEDARIAAAKEEEAQRLSLEKLKNANDKLAAQRENTAELQGQLDELKDRRAETVVNQDKALQSLEAAHAAQQQINAGLMSGMATDQKVHRGISGQGYVYQVGASGTPDNFIDFQRAQRYGGRADRDVANAAARNDAAAKRYDRLLDDAIQNKKISDRDQQFMNDYEAFQDSQRTESEWQAAIDNLKGSQKKTLSDLDKQMEDINTKLKELGLQ